MVSPPGGACIFSQGREETILTGSFDNTARLWQVPMLLDDLLKKGNLEKLTEDQNRKYGVED